MDMINQAPFLESTATQLTDGKSKYLQRCINNPEVHQTADTFIECKFDENNNNLLIIHNPYQYLMILILLDKEY